MFSVVQYLKNNDCGNGDGDDDGGGTNPCYSQSKIKMCSILEGRRRHGGTMLHNIWNKRNKVPN